MKFKILFSRTLSVCLVILLSVYLCSCSNIPVTPASDFECSFSEESETCAIVSYIGTRKNVNIPEEIDGYKVISIGINAFFENDTVERVIIPDTVKSIWNNAFKDCSNLKEVVFSDNITHIVQNAFENCTSLKEINLPPNLTGLESQTFWNCSSVKKITIPKTLNGCGSAAFGGCTSLEELVFEDGVKIISSEAFMGAKSLETLTIPASVEKIYGDTFFNSYSNIKSIKFLGDAPKIEGAYLNDPKEGLIIYYKEGTKGWEDSILSENFTLKTW